MTDSAAGEPNPTLPSAAVGPHRFLCERQPPDDPPDVVFDRPSTPHTCPHTHTHAECISFERSTGGPFPTLPSAAVGLYRFPYDVDALPDRDGRSRDRPSIGAYPSASPQRR